MRLQQWVRARRRFVRLGALLSFITLSTSCGHSAEPARHNPDSVNRGPLTCREGTPGFSVHWIDTSEGEDRVTNEDWCRSVGPWVVANYLPATPPLPVDSLLIATWNVYIGGGDLSPFVEELRAGLLTHGKPPSNYIVLLQEVYRQGPEVPKEFPETVTVPARRDPLPPSGKRMDILEAASRLGLWLFYVPSMRNGGPLDWPIQEDRGNAILSTIPLDDLTAITLPFEKYRRVVLGATVKLRTSTGQTKSVRVYNVHLDNKSRFPRYLQSAGVGRYRQAKALLPNISEPPAVLGGDLNTWAPASFEGALPLLREVFVQPEELLDMPTTAVPIIPDRRVDYIMFNLSEGMRGTYNRVDDRYGSDHYPLVGWLYVNVPSPDGTRR